GHYEQSWRGEVVLVKAGHGPVEVEQPTDAPAPALFGREQVILVQIAAEERRRRTGRNQRPHAREEWRDLLQPVFGHAFLAVALDARGRLVAQERRPALREVR